MSTKISSRTPVRVDLAGGTVDIWPLYLILPNAITVNMGISLWAETEIEFDPAARDALVLEASDQNQRLELAWKDLENPVHPALDLHRRFLKHFLTLGGSPRGAFRIRTRATSPAGAGLGGSSALSISMIGALAKWADPSGALLARKERLIEIARDVESQVLRVPAGLQDYYGAAYGGLQKLQWGIAEHARHGYPDATRVEVERRLLTFYSGQSRNSGINNWILYKAFLDRDPEVTRKFDAILDATHAVDRALQAKDWAALGEAIRAEWTTRATLASGISTPEMNAFFSALSATHPKAAPKVCGAGGGGCFFVYFPELSDSVRKEVTLLAERHGFRPLPFHSSPAGLEVN
jgi:D-glycero-alpha-D-manno-heptose-7-phosphate kinase